MWVPQQNDCGLILAGPSRARDSWGRKATVALRKGDAKLLREAYGMSTANRLAQVQHTLGAAIGMNFADESCEKFARGLQYRRGDSMLHLAVRNRRPAAFVRCVYDALEAAGALRLRNFEGETASDVDVERRFEFLHGGHEPEELWVDSEEAAAGGVVSDEKFGHWRPAACYRCPWQMVPELWRPEPRPDMSLLHKPGPRNCGL